MTDEARYTRREMLEAVAKALKGELPEDFDLDAIEAWGEEIEGNLGRRLSPNEWARLFTAPAQGGGLSIEAALREDAPLTIKQVAAYLQVHENTIYGWMREKDFPYQKIGRVVRFRRTDVDRWMREESVWDSEGDFAASPEAVGKGPAGNPVGAEVETARPEPSDPPVGKPEDSTGSSPRTTRKRRTHERMQ